MTTASKNSVLSRWARDDVRRILVATAVGTFVTIPLVRLWNDLEPLSISQGVAIACIIAWALLSGVNATLLLWTLRGVQGTELPPALGLEPRSDGSWHCPQKLLSRLDVTVSGLALAVVLMLVFVGGVNERASVVAAGLIMVAVSWVNVAVCNALVYARLDLSEGGLRFPGPDHPSWTRYLYLAFTVQSAFTTPDVEIVSDRLRRNLILQTLMAFVFNTVMLAVIVAVLLAAAG